MNFEDAHKFASDLLKTELPAYLTYHNLEHTNLVISAVEKIAEGENQDNESYILLKTAAAFHDIGYTQTYSNNEPIGAQIAKDHLLKFGYSQNQIAKIHDLILATTFPQKPKTHLDKIICDADLAYVGQKDFFAMADGLKLEFLHVGIIKTEKEWYKLQVAFLENYTFHTVTGKKIGEKQYQANLAQARKNYYMYENILPDTE